MSPITEKSLVRIKQHVYMLLYQKIHNAANDSDSFSEARFNESTASINSGTCQTSVHIA